ncbi:Leucine efflux protein [Thalassocella blandensis]|nr:Leucine efflux protein [Thalassocella blandensis]
MVFLVECSGFCGILQFLPCLREENIMLPIEVILPFVTASMLLALSPGPDNIFVLSQSAVNGPRAGISITLGLCTGLIFHTSIVVLGVAAIIQSSALLFTALKVIGALYLLYLAWQAFKAKVTVLDISSEEKLSYVKYFWRGILMNITNPKVSLFYLAFLPQFADVARGSLALQLVQLGVLFMLSAFIVFSTIAFLSGYMGGFIARSTKTQTWLNRFTALVFVGLAGRLLLAKQ